MAGASLTIILNVILKKRSSNAISSFKYNYFSNLHTLRPMVFIVCIQNRDAKSNKSINFHYEKFILKHFYQLLFQASL